MKKTFASLLTALLCFAFASCGGDSGPSSEPVTPTPKPTPATVAVTGVSLSTTSVNMKEFESVDVTATVTPDNASNKNVTWKTDASAVATVSGGKITAVAPGVANITVTTADGNKTATVKVTVTINMIGRQKKALLVLFEKAGGANWTNKEGWNTDAELKDWYGIELKDELITKIKLANNNLQGSIPEGLFGTMVVTKAINEADTRADESAAILSGLKELDLSGNKLTGEIPEAIGLLTTLTTLKLDNNQLTGSLPASISHLTKLTTLTIAHNELEGTLPKELVTSEVWKKIGSEVDLTQDNGKVIEVGKPDDPAPDPETVAVTGVTLDKSALALKVGETGTLTAKVTPENASNKEVTWKSDNTSVATVDANGKVTAVAVGETKIMVTTKDGDKMAYCEVTVTAPDPETVAVTGVTLDKSALALKVGETGTLTAKVTPENASNKEVTWSSDNTSVVTVDTNGKVTAVAEGVTKVMVTTKDGGKMAYCEVTVTASKPETVAVTGVTLNKTSLSLTVGGSEALSANVAPADATNKAVEWTSSDTNVATVDAYGKVTAKAAGTATITVKTKDGAKTATCTVTVTVPVAVKVTSIALSSASMTLAVNDEAQLRATVKPDDAADSSVTWASDHADIATVDATGKVKAVNAGTATITATAKDGSGVKATCVVTVVTAGNSSHTAGDVSSENQDW